MLSITAPQGAILVQGTICWNEESVKLLYIISVAAQMKRKSECAYRKKRRKENKKVSSLIPQKGILERILGNRRNEELMQCESFKELMAQTRHEMIKHKSFQGLMAQSVQERSEKHDSSGSANIEGLIQTKSFQQLARNTGKELMKTEIFTELAQLKTVEEVIHHKNIKEELIVKEEEEPVEPAWRSAEERLHDLFGKDLEANKMILSIIATLESGELKVNNPEPKYFDGLSYVMDRFPHLLGCVRDISIVLGQPYGNFAGNIYDMLTVLVSLIEQAFLRRLTLQRFHPMTLVRLVKGYLRNQRYLEELNLEYNSLNTQYAIAALESLPPAKNLLLKLSHNRVDVNDEAEIREEISLGSPLLTFSLDFLPQHKLKNRK